MRRTLAIAAAVGGLGLTLSLLWPLRDRVLDRRQLQSTVWLDRHGERLAAAPGALDTWSEPVTLGQVSPHVILALLAAEDRRFYSHPGVDPLAMARAAVQNLVELRVVSGGSTLTQQLARLLAAEEAGLAGLPPPPRTLGQKLREAHLALRLELQYDKQELLTAFLGRAPFGNRAVGITAAAERYFGVDPARLSLAQAAFLAGLPKGPSHYDPIRRGERARDRQRRVLERMLAAEMITAGQAERALAEPIEAQLRLPPADARHAVGLAREQLGDAGQGGTVRLTLDAALQRDVEQIVADEIVRTYARGGRSAAVVVLDNQSSDLLAMVGAAFAENPRWGQYNAAVAVRQPGSALKPFIYAAALTRGETAATLAADIPRPFPDTWGVYLPDNYDGRFHGPVRYREALAQSLNVAAVDVLFRTGLGEAFALLDAAGLKTLDRRPDYFGLGLTLGSGGVRPVDLANAYAALARGGLFRPWRLVAAHEADGVRRDVVVGDATRILDPRIAFVVGDILADEHARKPQFGERSVLATPYWTAVKTGTSKGFRDNWTVGYSETVTVAVWVGDPRGGPMHRMSGVEGAGVIWRKVMNRASGRRSRRPSPPEGLVQVRVCHVSGERLGPDCDGGRDEWFLAGTGPTARCSYHRTVEIDPENGLLVPPGCRLRHAERRRVTVYPSPFDRWAVQAEAGIAERTTPRCPAPPAARVELALLSPGPTESLRLDPEVPRALQALPLQAVVRGAAGPITFLVDDRPVGRAEAPHLVYWPLEAGLHRIRARDEQTGAESPTHRVDVR